MSNFQNMMAADLASTFINIDEFADAALFVLPAPASPFTCNVVVGDGAPSVLSMDAGLEDRRPVTLTGQYSVIFAGILAALGTARLPQRGDRITIATGANAANYEVISSSPDMGDGLTILCAVSALLRPGGLNAVEVR